MGHVGGQPIRSDRRKCFVENPSKVVGGGWKVSVGGVLNCGQVTGVWFVAECMASHWWEEVGTVGGSLEGGNWELSAGHWREGVRSCWQVTGGRRLGSVGGSLVGEVLYCRQVTRERVSGNVGG